MIIIFTKTQKMVLIALFIALSVIGAQIEIPSPVGTLGLDSMPGFLAAVLVGGLEGGVIAFLGHMVIAARKGFFLTLPVHLIVAVMMFIAAYTYGYLNRKFNGYVAIIAAILVNGILAPLSLLVLPNLGWGFFMATTPFILLASVLNVLLSYVLYSHLKRYFKNNKQGTNL